ncbi:MAG: DUF4988 domain-containing protein [Tannerellaceae bacterium]|jgi:hypothetical protein|nr:DUF4988 domain-containing protein [Tannerellaceae bacterium]
MSAKKIKSILFYLIPLGVLFAYFFTTCYGTEIDDLDYRITTVEQDLKEIKEKIASGKVIESVTSITGGFKITFTDGTNYDIVNGAQGAKGDEWAISGGFWYNVTTGTLTGEKAVPEDGRDAKAPTISDEGYWTFYEWNSSEAKWDSTVTKMMADTLLMYLVDFGDYYELYTPIQEKDENGNLVTITDPVTGKTKVKRDWDVIKLPKYNPDPEPALVFKFIGYAIVLRGDTVTQMLTEDLELPYTFLDHVHYGNLPVSEDSTLWKWRRRATGELVEDQFRIARLINDSLAVVFSINKSNEYMLQLGEPSSPELFELRNTRNEALRAIRLDRPKFFDDKGLISKAGSNNDTLYFARLRDPQLSYIPFVQTGLIYYRLVINDSIRSELAPYPLRISQTPPLAQAMVENLIPSGIWNGSGSEWTVPNDTTIKYRLKFNADSVNLFDHYISVSTSPLPNKIILSSLAGDSIVEVFKVDTLLSSPGDNYPFNIIVHKLQKDGAIYQEIVKVRATNP